MATITLAELPACTRRELNRRQSNGISVALYWEERDGALSIGVTDDRDPSRDFTANVQANEAAFAFKHPFLFAPDRGPVSRALYAVTETDRDEDDDEEVIA